MNPNPTIGILGFQGCITPHLRQLQTLGVAATTVRRIDELNVIDKLILPGGESTTMLHFLAKGGWTGALREFATHKSVWGVCAGSILLAREVENPRQDSLGILDLKATRNFYGSQLESFKTTLEIRDTEPFDITVDFIRAPRLEALSEKANPIAFHEGVAVGFQQGRHLACSFHPELGDDPSLHRLFLKL